MKRLFALASVIVSLIASSCDPSLPEERFAGDEPALAVASALTTTNDLTVAYIQRLPVLSWIQNSPNPAVEGWPAVGQPVTWRGFVRNVSPVPRNNVQVRWSPTARPCTPPP